MSTCGLLVTVVLLVLANEVSSSNTRKSGITLDLCGSLQDSNEIIIGIVPQNDETRPRYTKITGDGNIKQYKVYIDGASLQQGDKYQFRTQQKSIKQVTVSSTASHICVNALVIDTIIVVDQPTDFNTTCLNSSSDAVLERPCKQFGDSIDVSKLFVCPERLKDLLLKQKIVKATTGSQPTDGEPPTYDIINDMLQAASAIGAGVAEGAGTITEARKKYREASKAKPLKKLGTLATRFETVSSFISAIAPVFSIFSGVASIMTTLLTPNPFDELAKYLDQEFKQINNRLTDIQADIADLGRLIEAKGGVLAMTEQLSAIRYTIRNYGVLVNAMSKKPVCGAGELSKMPEVERFIKQYEYDFVDNRLLDLYGVEFGELPEATSLLRPYMMAYCHGKKNLVQKLAEELTYYGYAGLQCHFTYHSLATATKGLKSDLAIKEDDVWITKLYRLAKKANVFREALKSTPELGPALNFDLEDEILLRISQNEATVFDWLKKRILNANDWPYQCFFKEANGTEKKSTLYLRYQKLNSVPKRFANMTAKEFLSSKPYDRKTEKNTTFVSSAANKGDPKLSSPDYASRKVYIRAPKEVKVSLDPSKKCKKAETDIAIFVSYCPNPNTCNVKKKVWVAWEMFAICFKRGQVPWPGRVMGPEEKMIWIPETMLNEADLF